MKRASVSVQCSKRKERVRWLFVFTLEEGFILSRPRSKKGISEKCEEGVCREGWLNNADQKYRVQNSSREPDYSF